MLLLHGEPELVRLEESFSRVNDLTCEVHYTGYVVQPPTDNSVTDVEDLPSPDTGEPTILVSVGGGRFGHALLECVVKTAPLLEKTLPHCIRVFTEPLMQEEKFLQLQ